MSNGKEAIPGGGGGDTITLTPLNNHNVYPHQGIRIVASISMASKQIPTNATIDFSGSSNGATANVKALLHNGQDWTAVPVEIDPDSGGLTGKATLYARHVFTDTSNQMVINAKAGSVWTDNPPPAATTVTYDVLTTQPTITCSGPSKTVLAVAATNQLTPSADACMTQFTCTVMDGATPVPDYVVEWHEGTDESFGLFTMLVNSYASATATYADKLPSDAAVFVDNGGGVFIRTTTDSSGTANLYIVAKNTPWAIATSVRALYDFQTSYEYARPFFVFDQLMVSESLDGFAPKIDDPTIVVLPETQPRLNFSGLENPPNVRVTIPRYADASPMDDVYLLLNGAIAAGPYQFDDEGSELSCEFPASLAYTTTDQGDLGQENELRYVVSLSGTGQILASPSIGFWGYGDNIQLMGGILAQANLESGATAINYTMLQMGPVTIKIPLDQTKVANWKAEAGDVFTAVAYLNGFVTGTDVRRTPATVLADPLPPITANDLTNGSVLMTFPVGPFKDWDRQRDKPNAWGTCCIVYKVQRVGQDDQISRLHVLHLDTADHSD